MVTRALGNDLVWLGDPANAGRHTDRRLLERILTPQERTSVVRAVDSDRLLWCLWAAKESAYKCLVQDHPSLIFSPRTLEVTIDSGGVGTVTWNQSDLPLVWRTDVDWVHVAVGGAPEQLVMVSQRRPFGRAESDSVRLFALEQLRVAGYPEGAVEDRPPVYRVEGVRQSFPLSLSHDGPYEAVAFRRWPS